ncbi:MAG: UDP-glucose 4-epimerase GalE [Proteobacteria bacterium]|nr:UDP-glucose 4-epimerase GalE [Pseudomonadota bacterium]
MANFLVVGGAGYVGSHVCLLLVKQGHRVTVVDNLSTGHPEALFGVRLLKGDMGQRHLLDLIFETTAVDVVLHLAIPDDPMEKREPIRWYQNTVVPTLALVQAMRDHGVRRMVFGSSAEIYEPGAPGPLDEEAPLGGKSPYSAAHTFLDQALVHCGEAWGLSSVRLRYFNAAGAWRDADLGEDHLPEAHFIPQALQVAMGRKACVILSGSGWDTPDGTRVADYLHVEDIARAHVLAAEHLLGGGGGGAFNLGLGQGFSEKEVLKAARRVTGKRIPQKVLKEDGPGGYKVVLPDRARKVLGWEPELIDLDAMVASAWEWQRTRPFGYGGKSRRWPRTFREKANLAGSRNFSGQEMGPA